MAGILFIVSAPSCAGKTTLLQALLKSEVGSMLRQYVTYTTKIPRKGDEQGKDFHFISKDEFEAKIANHFFVEWSNAYAYYYGTPKSIIDDLDAGVSYIIILDRAGAEQMLRAVPSAVSIWIYVSREEELKDRILKRGQDSSEQIRLRLDLAREEIALELERPIYQFHIKNDDFYASLWQLKEIILLYLQK